MLSISFDPFPVLETERLILRRPEYSDVDEIFEYRSNKDFMRFIMHRYATERIQVEETIDKIHRLIANNEGINWAITEKGNDKLIGMVSYVRFIKDHYRAEIGYMLHSPYQGKGIINEAISAVVDYGFNTLGLHSIEAVINAENKASLSVAERFGFSRDAYFRDYLFLNGGFVDACVYSLLKSSPNQ